MRRTPLRPSRTPIARGATPKASNPKRKAREFARTYHSVERVEFVKAMPCALCRATCPSQNAHTTGGGMGRKGAYTTIVPLCPRCHAYYDGWTYPLSEPHIRELVENKAPSTEAAWLSRSGDTGSDET